MAEHQHGTDDTVTGPKSASGNVSSTGSHSMSMGGMEMTFTGWSSYTLTLLSGSWQVKKPWQFFLTWLAVFLASILYHAIRFAICGLDCMINSTAKSNPAYIGMHDTAGAGELSNFQTSRRFARPNGWLALKLLHGLMTGCHYGLSLMLMLVAMSMNPTLILALCLGYAAGDILMAELHYDLQSGSSGLVRRTNSWWMKHSYPEHVALIAGIVTFPLSILITYALIDTACLQYKNGNSAAEKSPFAGSWVSDFCDFEIEPTQKKALQISLAVFYSWLAVLGVLCFLSSCNKRTFRFMHSRLPLLGITNGEAILFVGVASLLVFNCAHWCHTFTHMLDHSAIYSYWMEKSARRPTYFVTQVTGRLLDVSLGLLMLPVSKNSVLQLLLGVSYTGAMSFHKSMGWFFVMVSVVHVSAYIRSATIVYSTYSNKMVPDLSQMPWGVGNYMSTMGAIGTVLMAPPILLSFPYVRHHFYNLFYYSHLFLHVGIVFLWLHASSDLYYMMPAIGLYATDIVLRTISRYSPHKVRKVTPSSGGLVRIDFDISERQSVRHYLPGQFVRVCFPSINSLEWHPYTLVGPVGSAMGTIYLDPKMASAATSPKQMAWSRAICSKVQRDDPVSVDGPFGGLSFDPRDVSLVVCLVAGSGLPVALSVAQYIDSTAVVKENKSSVDLSEGQSCDTRVALIWCVNSAEDPMALTGIFVDLSERTAVTIHRNKDATNDTDIQFGTTSADACSVTSVGECDTGSAAVKILNGRLNFIDCLAQYDSAGDVGIVICGPPSFTAYAVTAAEDFTAHSKGRRNVLLSIESYRS